MNRKLLSLYGLKWNPFSPDLPVEALFVSKKIESFCFKVEHYLLKEGGFAIVQGDPGSGKSVALRLLADRLGSVRDVTVAALAHPQSHIADFYREMGDLFGVDLKPHNRWAGFLALRSRFQAHLESTLLRPVLLVDEAQEMTPPVLRELRILASTRFDSQSLLTVVLAGDGRLTDMLRREELLPLGSRIRFRLVMEYAYKDELRSCLEHLLAQAGNLTLLTPELKNTLCEHAVGNFRVLANLGAELLLAAAEREITQLDEKLYLELFQAPKKTRSPAKAARP
jgi:type II secretory pathway predicted ATPase ExeA